MEKDQVALAVPVPNQNSYAVAVELSEDEHRSEQSQTKEQRVHVGEVADEGGKGCQVCGSQFAWFKADPCGHEVSCMKDSCKKTILNSGICPRCNENIAELSMTKQVVNIEEEIYNWMESVEEYIGKKKCGENDDECEKDCSCCGGIAHIILIFTAPVALAALIQNRGGLESTDLSENRSQMLTMQYKAIGIFIGTFLLAMVLSSIVSCIFCAGCHDHDEWSKEERQKRRKVRRMARKVLFIVSFVPLSAYWVSQVTGADRDLLMVMLFLEVILSTLLKSKKKENCKEEGKYSQDFHLLARSVICIAAASFGALYVDRVIESQNQFGLLVPVALVAGTMHSPSALAIAMAAYPGIL